MARDEIALRRTLGAGPIDILAAVLRREMIAVAGFVAGVVGIAALGQLLTAFLFEIAPTDVGTIAVASAAFLIAAAAGSYPPIRRALQVEPRDLLTS